MGPQLPARLPEARRAGARARGRARARADRDRDAGRRRGHLRRLRHRGGGRGRHRLLPAEPDAADDARRGRASATRCWSTRLRERPPGPTIVYVTLQQTAERVAALLAGAGSAGAPVPRRHEHGGAGRGAGLVDGVARRRSSSRRSRSAWASTRPTSATSTTTTCPRAWRATRRRSAAPGATARRASASCSPARTTCPTLENFAYGDTPTREALAGAARGGARRPGGAEFAVSEYELSVRHDMRPLVLKTVLTYLELDGVLRQGTPFYAGYRLRPLGEASLDGRLRPLRRGARRFLRAPVAHRQDGPHLDDARPDDAAAELGEERSRILAALEYLEEQGLVELQPAEPRQRYTLLARPDSEVGARRRLGRALRAPRASGDRPDRERPRAGHPRRLPGAQPRRLLRRDRERSRCGHCSHCLTGHAAAPSRARAEAADRDDRRRRRARCAARCPPGGARRRRGSWRDSSRGITSPADEPREAGPGPALRLARRAAVRRRARLVRDEGRLDSSAELRPCRPPSRVASGFTDLKPVHNQSGSHRSVGRWEARAVKRRGETRT